MDKTWKEAKLVGPGPSERELFRTMEIHVSHQIFDQIEMQVYNQIWNEIKADVFNQIWNVREPVRADLIHLQLNKE